MSAGGGFTRTGICTIVDMDSLEIEVDVNEAYINRVVPEQPIAITLNAYPDWQIAGKVIAIIPTADRNKATVKVRIAILVKDPRILPDMGVKVSFLDAQQKIATQGAAPNISLPLTAVHSLDVDPHVFIVNGTTLTRQSVRIGVHSATEVTILDGLKGGERLVSAVPGKPDIVLAAGMTVAVGQ